MYLISDDTLHANQFTRSGTVRNISPTDFVLEDFDYTIQGWIVYIMRVNGEFMKGGIGKGMQRCRDEFNCLRPWKKCCPAGPPYGGDPWHLHALPAVRTKDVVVELFAKSYATEQEQTEDERELNDFYRGLWTKEGKLTWKPKSRLRLTFSTLRLGERQAAAPRGFRDRVSLIEQASDEENATGCVTEENLLVGMTSRKDGAPAVHAAQLHSCK